MPHGAQGNGLDRCRALPSDRVLSALSLVPLYSYRPVLLGHTETLRAQHLPAKEGQGNPPWGLVAGREQMVTEKAGAGVGSGPERGGDGGTWISEWGVCPLYCGCRGKPLSPTPLPGAPGPTHKGTMSSEELSWFLSNAVKSSTFTVVNGCPWPTTSRPSMSSERPKEGRLADRRQAHHEGLGTAQRRTCWLKSSSAMSFRSSVRR